MGTTLKLVSQLLSAVSGFKGYDVFKISEFDVALSMSSGDINAIYFICIHKKGTVVNRRSAEFQGDDFVFHSDQKTLWFSVSLSNSFPCLLLFDLKPLSM